MKEELRKIVDDNTTKKGRIFDYVIQVLILFSLTAFAIETLPNNSPLVKTVLHWIETISVVVFSIEYVLRIYIAKRPLRYIFSFYGIIDFFSNSSFLFKRDI